MKPAGVWSAVAVASALLLGGAWWVRTRAEAGGPTAKAGGARAVPVEVAPVEHRPLQERRRFTGTLEAAASFVVSTKVAGQLETIALDLGDRVERGQVVATLDDEEFRQAEAEAKADLAVANARKKAAAKAVEIAQRNYRRVESLSAEGITSEAELDLLRSAKLEAEADVAVANAQVTRAKAALEAARVRRGYTKIAADWPEGDDDRVVSRRYVDEGATVAANSSLLEIVDLDEIVVVVFATERDYGRLKVGQPVALETEAFPGETFEGAVDRIAPVFAESSRQARVELRVPNPDGRLRPGMFVRVSTVLGELERATVLPADALVEREGETIVYVVSTDGTTVTEHPVEVVMQDEGFAAVEGPGIEGRVVVLGQEALNDGAAIVIPSATEATP